MPCYSCNLKFWYAVSSLIISSKCFLISIMICSLTHGLFTSVLLNFQSVVNLIVIFLLLIYRVGSVWSENILWMISILRSLLRLYDQVYGNSEQMFLVYLKKYMCSVIVGDCPRFETLSVFCYSFVFPLFSDSSITSCDGTSCLALPHLWHQGHWVPPLPHAGELHRIWTGNAFPLVLSRQLGAVTWHQEELP